MVAEVEMRGGPFVHRYYLRGLVRPVAVNVERVRMTGHDSVSAVARTARAALADPTAMVAARLDVAAALAGRTPAAAADSLTFIRVAALSSVPGIAAPLEIAIDQLRHGRPADEALRHARRVLEPPMRAVADDPSWSSVVP